MGEATVSFLCAHIQRQTCSPFQTDAGLWQSVGVKFSLCRQLSRETETCSVSHLPDATAVLARSAGLGGYALAREKKNPCQHWSNSGPCPFSLQTMAYSHCRINSQSFQWLFFFLIQTAFGRKISLLALRALYVTHMFTCQTAETQCSQHAASLLAAAFHSALNGGAPVDRRR